MQRFIHVHICSFLDVATVWVGDGDVQAAGGSQVILENIELRNGSAPFASGGGGAINVDGENFELQVGGVGQFLPVWDILWFFITSLP